MKNLLPASLIAYATVLLGTAVAEPHWWCTVLLQSYALFFLLPALMASTILSVCLPLCAVIGLIGLLFAWGRPSGAGALIGEVLAIPAAVVPGYVRALKRVRSPHVWGGLIGGLVGTITLLAWLIAQSGGAPG